MKKILLPTLLTISTMPLISIVGCTPGGGGEEPFDGIEIDVNQDITQAEDNTKFRSTIFTADTTKTYRFHIDCSTSTAQEWNDFGSLHIRNKSGELSSIEYEATYVELDGEELPYLDDSSSQDKHYMYLDLMSKTLLFLWPGHNLSKDSKMTFDIQFQTSDEIYVVWYNET